MLHLSPAETYTVLKKDQAQAFTEHLSTIDFMMTWSGQGKGKYNKNFKTKAWKRKWRDACSVINKDKTIHTKVFRKETHTDEYLNLNINHAMEHKRSVVRARSIVSDLAERKKEMEHVRKALECNWCPNWTLAETWEEVKENTKEEKETMMVASGPKRERRERRDWLKSSRSYISSFSEEQNFWWIQGSEVP